MWRNRINWFGNNESDANLNIFNYDQVSSHWFPTRKGSHACAGWKTGLWRRHGRGRAGPSRMKMWSSPGHELISKYSTYKFGNNKTPPRHIRREREKERELSCTSMPLIHPRPKPWNSMQLGGGYFLELTLSMLLLCIWDGGLADTRFMANGRKRWGMCELRFEWGFALTCV